MNDTNETAPGAGAEDGETDVDYENENAAAADEGVYIDGGADKIHIADEVINQIIVIAAGRVPGASLSGGGEGIAGFLGMKGPARGVRIETDEKSIGVDLSVSVEYGRKINETAKALQDEIRKDLSEMTGMEVTRVNVHVLTINTKDAPAVKPQKTARQQKDPPSPEPVNKDEDRTDANA